MPARHRAPDHDARPTLLPSGNWGVRVSLGGRRYHRTAATAAAARAARDELKRLHRLGLLNPEPPPPEPLAPTVAGALAAWLPSVRDAVEPSSYARYALEARIRLVPALGTVPLPELTRAQVRAALEAMRHRVSARTVRYARETLRLALQRAVDDGLLTDNPAAGVRLPKERRAPARPLGPADVRALLAIDGGDDRWHPLWLVALYTGMRLGELLGLPWSQVDWQGGVQVCQVLAVAEGGGFHLRGYPKRQASVRRIDVPAEVVDALRAVADGQNDAQRRLGLVFSSRVGTWLLPRNVERAFQAACRDAGIVLRRGESLHLLRHTYASTLLAAGRPITEVSYLLGHGNAAITLAIYSHFVAAPTTAAAGALSVAYSAPNGAKTGASGGDCR